MSFFKFELSAIKGFFIDMDGVIYKSKRTIDGAVEFIEYLKENDIPFKFLTNNSQRNNRDVKKKLEYHNIFVDESNIFTCATATARFLSSQKKKASVFLIGEGGLQQAIYEEGLVFDDSYPDYVVLGEGRTVNMEVIDKAINLVLGGAKLITTNPDVSCPTADGLRAGCGAIANMIESASGKPSFSIGKPNPIIFREAHRDIGLRIEELCMVGDTMSTDIMGAVQMGINSILVLSGGTSKEDISNYAFTPGLVVNSVKDIYEKMSLNQKVKPV